jgi:MscS family membrane protein
MQFVQSYSFEIQLFLIVFFLLSVNYITNKILNLLKKKFKKTKNIWDDILIKAARKPLKIIIYALTISFFIEWINRKLGIKFIDDVKPVRNVFIVFASALFVLRFIKQFELQFAKKHQDDKEKITTINAITNLLKVSVFITAGLILMQSFGINISGVLAFGGVSGIAIGFAAKDLLANFFGAIMIYLDKPFKIGDWVRSPDREIEGTVENIGWRQTRIRKFDQRPIYVPNSVFSTIVVENPSRMTHRRIYENIGVKYKDFPQLNNISAEVKSYLKSSKRIDAKQTIIVNFNNFAGSSLEIMIYCFTHEINWVKFHAIKQEILLDIGNIIEKNNASIAFPTITLDKAS